MKFKSIKQICDRIFNRGKSKSLRPAPSGKVPVIASATTRITTHDNTFTVDTDVTSDVGCSNGSEPAPADSPLIAKTTASPTESSLVEGEAQQDTEPDPPQDATIHAWAASSSMAAFLTVKPPINGGQDITLEQVTDFLTTIKVTANIDYKLLQKITDERQYPKNLLIAKGIPPIHGINGKIADHFSREAEIQLKEDEKGTIDFKNLNLVQEVTSGTVICDILPVKPGVDGLDITGKVLPAKKGIAPRIPMGKNTHLSEDGAHLVATTGGQLIYEGEKFCIHEKLVINKNIDSSVGNLNFNGDIEIHGDVQHGFSVIATGNITVRGLVEAANLEAGGNITLQGGMNGDMNTSLKTQGDILSRFLENCTVYANGSIYCESILNSRIFCNKLVSVTKGKGVIISCNITAHSVEARTIGTRANHMTSIVLGTSFNNAQEENEAKARLKEVVDTIEKMNKNIIYLTGQTSLSPQKVEILRNLLEQTKIYIKRRDALNEEIHRLINEPPDLSDCRIQASLLNPPLKVTIGRLTRLIDETTSLCNIYLSDVEGDIVIGTM